MFTIEKIACYILRLKRMGHGTACGAMWGSPRARREESEDPGESTCLVASIVLSARRNRRGRVRRIRNGYCE